MNAIVLSQKWFGFATKILNAVDVVSAFCRVGRMVAAMMVKAADIEHIARSVRIGVDHAIRLDFAENNMIHRAFHLIHAALQHDLPCRLR